MNRRIDIFRGDITKMQVDAIVNAANTSLLGGGGVDGAIHRAGGPAILEECIKIRNRQGGCKVGEAVITTAGNMPAKYVIHTVGPVWSQSNKQANELLANAYSNSLKLAVENQVETIAFPNISTGIYHFPKDIAAEIAIKTIKEIISKHQQIRQVIFVCFDDENYSIYEQLLSYQCGN
ncbi:O-acetyl-ADP-ribose deacetylase [Mucilaginibacter ginsenosidivorans]|uniref:O-acetyl-ADP-ribose deacetylase n=1 Tax=Mucilaginibacter ginsenosidivorans TaxID=398053 RepID=A0A5B8USD8_9SPHI|nr:O-acetyl-ADP-ribose deacetylase [Mucilaginibacter ginsenosidivorans]QEC61778.1 O-acetyl-ADP-ribose deacetylase [Mucilaginibacter ginsenosidivorans]